MTQPIDKHRETAREQTRIILGLREGKYCYARTCFKDLHGSCVGCEDFDAFAERVATALADTEAAAFTAGRADRQAEDAEIARSVVREKVEPRYLAAQDEITSKRLLDMSDGALLVEAAILAPSSGPTYEQRIRQEIAAEVGTLKVHYLRVADNSPIGRDYYEVSDVLGMVTKK